MSDNSPPIEQQYFARTQTPESPRPVHAPEPAKIPVLLNQMDPASNDLATYNIPTDQNFAHYGDSLENPAYKTNGKEDTDPFRDFLRNADSAVANNIHPDPNQAVHEISNAVASNQYTNHAGFSLPNAHLASSSNATAAPIQYANSAQAVFTLNQTQPSDGLSNNDAGIERGNITIDAQNKDEEKDETTTNNIISPINAADAKSDAGVDYQSLLDTIAQSSSTAPPVESVAAPTTDSVLPDAQASSLPSFPGLPPKPPVQESQASFPSSFDQAQAQQPMQSVEGFASDVVNVNDYQPSTNQTSSSNYPSDLGTIQASSANPFGMDMSTEQMAMHMQQGRQYLSAARSPSSRPDSDADRPWSPQTQSNYDRFLEDERRYVTEGIWDRFPLGSRLFVGNLPSEKVTKRDLFHRFHKYGRLAQISIKQAYGFVQYHDAQGCKAALDAEQGVELRGRKVHLEISKPQKNTKNANQQNNQKNNQNQNRKRSRSPQRRSYSDFRDEPSRRREEYRRRSPSPRGYRRDDRGGSRDDRRSPMVGSSYGTPQLAYDDEMRLPYPRRDPRYVPDVQIIVVDGGVNQAFVNWVEDGFRRKSLSVASTWLNERTPLPAVIKRQIMEGVQAVIKVSTSHQTRSKIPLQVFDRSAGTSNITFNEYVDLDVPVAGDVVIQARQRERAPRPPFPPPIMPPQSPYQHQSPNTPWVPQPQAMPFPPPQQAPPPQHYPYQQPPPQQQYRPQPYPTPNSATSQPANLHELLANLKGGTGAPPTPQSAHSVGQPFTPYGQPPPPLQYYSQPPQHQYGAPPPPVPPQQNGAGNVQDIMAQLARYQRS